MHGEILRCEGCGLVYPRTLIDEAALARLYRDGAYTYGDLEPHIRAIYARHIRRAMRSLPTKGERRSIDIGCGNGFMLEEMRRLGFEASGIEPSADAIALADPSVRPHIVQGLASPSLLPAERFDLLTCFQTLDHVPDPAAFVALCLSALRPGGVALFINHDVGSFTARLLGERCPMIDVEHTFLHTKRTMRLLFERAGFEQVTVFPVANAYPLRYWLHLLPVSPKARKAALSIAGLLHAQSLVIPLFAGNLGLMARRPLHSSITGLD